jgi:hypothetical protein
MNGIVFYIGLGLGLALAAGLRPFFPALLAGGLASDKLLGVDFAHEGDYRFLQSGWWLVALAAALLVGYLLQLRVGSERFSAGPLAATFAGLGIGIGALLFAGTLADHGYASLPGLIGGAACATLGQLAIRPLLAGARERLSDRGAREALTLYVDGASLLCALLAALLRPLGYLLLALLAWLIVRTRQRAGEKYAGLRILRR